MQKVLIIDDNPADSRLLADNIKERNAAVQIKVLNNSTDARNEFVDFTPDLTFIDISMPEKDGFQLLEELNSLPQRADNLIIVLSGYSDVGTLDMAMKLGADNYFVKPRTLDGYRKLAENISELDHLKEFIAL
ncbi:MAG: response regulator [Pseudomonadota bacterium]